MKELIRGITFADRYEVIEELGKGGMGRVYKVLDREINEEVALKILNPEITSDEKMIERFRNELKIARKIVHKNVCRMYDLCKEEGTKFIIMEYVPGEDLKSLIRKIGQFTVGKAVFVARQVCEGLAEAHILGIVHRDLKPQNIMIDKEGNVHIMDFGIARSLEAKGITETGVIIGTPEYMSPEQVEGKEVDQRSDIYSLGVVLYELVTGRVPFKGDTSLSIAVKHKTEAPLDPRKINTQIPEDLSQVILRCMEKNKEKRHQTAEQLLTELKKIEKCHPTIDIVLPGRKFELGDKKKRFKIFALPGVFLLIAVIVVGAYFLHNQILKTSKKDKEAKPTVTAEQTTQRLPISTPQFGKVEINSAPEEADVYVDDKHEGVTPFKRELANGKYKIKIRKYPESLLSKIT